MSAASQDGTGIGAGTSKAVMLAADRLSLSRLQLQQVLMPPPHASTHASKQARANRAASTSPTFPRWLERLLAAPAASVLLVNLQSWWTRHPMRLALMVATDTAESVIQPVAQKHPVRLVLGAAAAGALLVLSRPWRWLPRAVLTPALLASLLPALIKPTASPLSGRAWMGMLAALNPAPGAPPRRR